ncbi:multisubunit Na+/H+ antiporter MnhE subunit [Salirhabdus euzebyi]|uniref:Multisubunit Na+/H+ antiporter MnhE subunit n=1 Tax=Salirhabdus euzebyi TaxID=394506 RepID=A0A841PWG8_9BACI|nr:hypothetical protein [Salirhabdus euzebyi]MBB6451656.1 multisubunit Na+/H+ antiporter MnhE subunit [Salirhabdus euzebyi]
MDNRYIKLFIAFIVSALLVFFTREMNGYYVLFIDNLPYIGYYLPEILFDILHLIAIIFFFKFSYIWIKELWKLK